MIVGIDPGQSGGIAGTAPTGQTDARLMPLTGKEVDGHELTNMLRGLCPSLVILEKIHAMPKQGASSTFKFAMGFGLGLGNEQSYFKSKAAAQKAAEQHAEEVKA
ncbi:RuvC family protein [Halomonas sp. WWR20]